MSLYSFILNRKSSKPILTYENLSFDALELRNLRNNYLGLIANLQGKSVAVYLGDIWKLLLSIIFLDGHCSRIALIPRGLNHDSVRELISQSGSEIVLCDRENSSHFDQPTCFWEPLASEFQDHPTITSWLLPTSGTTGTPKLIEHTIESLSRSIKSSNAVGESLCWASLYDIRRFAGLQVLLQSLLGGSTFFVSDPSTQTLSELIPIFARSSVNALSATPTMWQKILMTRGSELLNLRQITLGGEIVNQKILDALSSRYPSARISHIYASTEFGYGFSVNDGKEGFPESWLYGETPLLRVDHETGELLIRRFDDWHPTGDSVTIRNGRVIFQGRLNGSINVGGNKVMPEEVEQVLLKYPGVMLASVSARKSSFMGNLVQADIVMNEMNDLEKTKKELLLYCKKHLEPYKVPVFINIIEDIKTSETGKIERCGGNT